jgi:hypothetical protein
MAFVSGSGSLVYAQDPGYVSGNSAVPYKSTDIAMATASGGGPYIQMNNTFQTNSDLSAGTSTVLILNNALTNGQITAPGVFGLYVDPADGILRVKSTAPIAFRFFIWLMASAQFPNR